MDIIIHNHYRESDKTNKILEQLLLINQKLDTIMSTNQEMLDLLIAADEQTNEIAADLADLIANAGVSQEVKDKAAALVERLKAVAATHTPGGTPPVEG